MSQLIKLFFPLMLIVSSAFADYSISPIKLMVTPENKITTLEFRNDNDENKKFQVSVLEVIKQGKKEIFKESKEIDAVPVMFSLAPGKTQIIRVRSQNVEKLEKRNFKISIKELFTKRAANGQSVVHLIPEFRVPIVSSTNSEDAQKVGQ